jgi:adenylate kinase
MLQFSVQIMNAPRSIFFLGKPGSGKGTQAKRLSERTGWPVFGAGDQLRDIAASGTYTGNKIREQMDQGILVPPWIVRHLFLRILQSNPRSEPIIFDGFNRKPEEARLIIDTSVFLDRPFVVLNIAVSDEEVTARLRGRARHSGRADDHAIDVRLEEYATFTEPALEIFRAHGACIDINGAKSPDAVTLEVAQKLGIQ